MGAIYADNLIEITDRGVTFHHYYFPFGDKRVEWSRISSIEARQPSVKTGSWRIWGTGNLSTWFPLDARRPRRDRILLGIRICVLDRSIQSDYLRKSLSVGHVTSSK